MGRDSCCSRFGPCGLHEGNCHDDSDCSGDLVCGDKNCFELWGHHMDFNEWSNCCQEPIPVDGGWSKWENNNTSGSDCIENADGNWMMNMTRYCNNPEPAYGGAYCVTENGTYYLGTYIIIISKQYIVVQIH